MLDIVNSVDMVNMPNMVNSVNVGNMNAIRISDGEFRGEFH